MSLLFGWADSVALQNHLDCGSPPFGSLTNFAPHRSWVPPFVAAMKSPITKASPVGRLALWTAPSDVKMPGYLSPSVLPYIRPAFSSASSCPTTKPGRWTLAGGRQFAGALYLSGIGLLEVLTLRMHVYLLRYASACIASHACQLLDQRRKHT
jgi:hypothetical protein